MRHLRSAVCAVALLAGCAGPTPEQAVQADPTLAVSQPGDAALSCEAVGVEITKMNGTITQAQRMTDLEVNNRSRLDAPTQDTRLTTTTVGGSNGPSAIGDSPVVATGGGGAESDDALMKQQARAKAAIARANELIRLGRAKHCFA